MKVEVQKLPKSEVKLIIEIPEEELAKFEEEAVQNIGQNVKIEGFRPGKASKQAVIKRVGEQAFMSEVMEVAIPKTYMKAVMDEKINVVARPKITMVSDKPLKYEAQVAVLPEVKMKDYSKIKIKSEKVEVKDKEVDETIDQLKQYRKKWKEVERAAKKGDRVETDFEGFGEDGKAVEGTKSKNHPIVIGDGLMIPGFEDELIGLKKGDKKEFEIKFPKQYKAKDFQGKKLKFKVEAKMVEESEEVELNEEFVEQVTGKKKSVDEFKKEVRENIEKEKQNGEKNRRENEFLEKLMEHAEMELPDALIDEEIDFMLETTKMELEKKGLKWEDYLEHLKKEGKELADLRKESQPEAEKRVKLRLVLAHIFKEEKDMDVSEKELNEEIERMTGFMPEERREEARKHYGPDTPRRNQLANKMRLDKFLSKHLTS